MELQRKTSSSWVFEIGIFNHQPQYAYTEPVYVDDALERQEVLEE